MKNLAVLLFPLFISLLGCKKKETEEAFPVKPEYFEHLKDMMRAAEFKVRLEINGYYATLHAKSPFWGADVPVVIENRGDTLVASIDFGAGKLCADGMIRSGKLVYRKLGDLTANNPELSRIQAEGFNYKEGSLELLSNGPHQISGFSQYAYGASTPLSCLLDGVREVPMLVGGAPGWLNSASTPDFKPLDPNSLSGTKWLITFGGVYFPKTADNVELRIEIKNSHAATGASNETYLQFFDCGPSYRIFKGGNQKVLFQFPGANNANYQFLRFGTECAKSTMETGHGYKAEW